MEALIETFHVDVKLIIAQLVNFLIVLAVLWYVALKPLLKIMGERSKTIEESLQKADDIEKKFLAANVEQEKILSRARIEAHDTIQEAEKRVLAEKERVKAETKKEVVALVESAKKQITMEKEKMTKELQRETAELVILASRKVLKEHSPKNLDPMLAEEAIKKL